MTSFGDRRPETDASVLGNRLIEMDQDCRHARDARHRSARERATAIERGECARLRNGQLYSAGLTRVEIEALLGVR
jgi:hypothetical protein